MVFISPGTGFIICLFLFLQIQERSSLFWKKENPSAVICLIREKLRYIWVFGANWRQGRRSSCAIPSPDLCVVYILTLSVLNKLHISTIQIQISFLWFHYHSCFRKISPCQRVNLTSKTPGVSQTIETWVGFKILSSFTPVVVLTTLCWATNIAVLFASLLISLAINYRKKH